MNLDTDFADFADIINKEIICIGPAQIGHLCDLCNLWRKELEGF